MRAGEFVAEIGAPGELDVSEKLQKYFTDRGYTIEGEGRDQMVFHRPGQRHVVKVIGLGDDLARRDNVADYVRFFAMNQQNPHFPRVSQPREIRIGDEIYTIYRQELLQSLPGEEEVMDWMEKFGAALSDPARARAWLRENPPPSNLPRPQVQGLYAAVRRLQQFYGDDLGGSIKLDLGHTGNFMQRTDGTIVVVDPLAYDESYDTYSESVADVAENFADGKVKEMAPPPISIKSATLYHGTPTLNNAQGIIRNGLKFDAELIAQKYQGSENFAPLPGVYLSKDFGNAVRYSFMSEVPDDQYAEHIKQEPYGYVFEFSGQDLSQTSPDEDELGRLLEKFVKAKNPPPKLSALIQSVPENLKSQLSHPDVSFETIAVAGKWLVSKLKPQTLQYLMQRYINVVNYSIMKPVAVWKIPKPEQRFLRDRQGTFDTHNGYINWANRYGKKQPLEENFADGRVKGKSRPGRVKRSGASCKGSVTDLRARAKKYGGERGKMYHWCANMKGGKKK